MIALSKATSGNVPADASDLTDQEANSDFIKTVGFGQREFGNSGNVPLFMWLRNNRLQPLRAIGATKWRIAEGLRSAALMPFGKEDSAFLRLVFNGFKLSSANPAMRSIFGCADSNISPVSFVMAILDDFIQGVDKVLRTVGGVTAATRPNPGAKVAAVEMPDTDRRRSAGLMRVNHVGEVCAQALYDAQGHFARTDSLKRLFSQAAREEADHLAWTAQRLEELGSRPSLLNPLWYAGAFAMGAVAARIGDAQSLGFVVETERQVEAHLASHLALLPASDEKSRAIVEQMRVDEVAHGAAAQALGAAAAPAPVQAAMRAMAKVMTTTAYYI